MTLQLLKYLTDVKEINGVAISGKLQCSCGEKAFQFYHTGKSTKGIISPYIVKKDRQLILIAKCPQCNNEIEVYNSTKDGVNARPRDKIEEFAPLVIQKSKSSYFPVIVKYNYFLENIKYGNTYSNLFENCFIYILNDDGKEGKALIEE